MEEPQAPCGEQVSWWAGLLLYSKILVLGGEVVFLKNWWVIVSLFYSQTVMMLGLIFCPVVTS